MRFVLLVGLGLCFSILTKAQRVDCDQTLERARNNFAEGHLYVISSILEPCLSNGFNKNQKIEAHLMLTRTYLLIDDPIKAENSYLNLLKLDPEYDINEEVDPVDVVYLNDKFTTTPIFVLSFKGGVNSSNASVIQNFGTDNTSDSNEKYSSSIGFNFGAGIELNLSDHLSLGFETNFLTQRYQYKNQFFNGDTQNFSERSSVIDAPLLLKYRTKINKFYPFVYGGISHQYLLSSKGEFELIDVGPTATDGSPQAERQVTGPEENLKELRNNLNRFLVGGIGASFRLGYNYIFVDARYYYGLTNFVNQEAQYSNPRLLYQFGYVDDLKRMQTLSISIGWIKPLYKPRKIEGNKGFFNRILGK